MMRTPITGIIESEQADEGARDLFDGGRRYRAIYADPPWQFQTRSEKGRDRSPDGMLDVIAPAPLLGDAGEAGRVRHYPTMPTAEICALDVGALAASDCLLFLWVSSPMLLDGIRVGEAWGFKFVTVAFVWAKTTDKPDVFPIGPGYWTRSNPELCLLFKRGDPERLSAAVRQLIIEPVREHSRKPDRVRFDIRRLAPGPYLELFARTPWPGWDRWGNQTERFAEAD